MRSLFYQANFCAECGNALSPPLRRFGFTPRHLCEACATRLKQRRLITPLAGVLLAASLAAFAFSHRQGSYRQGLPPVPQLNSIAQEPTVSARDSIVNFKTRSLPEPETRVLCGARTRRGTPCRHRVQLGQRCAQHRGMPSLLDPATAFPPATSQTKSRKH